VAGEADRGRCALRAGEGPPAFKDASALLSPVDFLAECWTNLRHTSRLEAVQGRIEWGESLSGRDRRAAENTLNGLLKLLYPDPETEVPAKFLDWAAGLAVEVRRRVKEAQAFIGENEFGDVDLAYSVDGASKMPDW